MTRDRWIVLFAAWLVGCDKDKPPSSVAPAPDPTSSAVPSLSAVAPRPSAIPAVSVSVAAPAVDSRKGRDGGKATVKLEPASKRVSGKNFTLELGAAGCKAGAECAMTIKLVAEGGYHVNKEYPYKFVATAAPGVVFQGKDTPTIFSRAAGDFVEHGEKSGTMTVRFTPASGETANIAGTFKLSVCSADQCQIEQEAIALDVPVVD